MHVCVTAKSLAVGVSALPYNVAVEVEGVFEVVR